MTDVSQNGADWRAYPDKRKATHPAVAARDAIRAGDVRNAAEAYLLDAAFQGGAAERTNALKAADICATLSLRDAVDELNANLKLIAREEIERRFEEKRAA